MSNKCGYSNDQMQDSIDKGWNLILFVSHSGDRQAFLITVPQQATEE